MKGGGGGFLRNFSRHHDSSLFCSRDKEPFFVKDVDVVVVVVVVVRTLRRRRYLTPALFSSGLLKNEDFPLFLFPQLPLPSPPAQVGTRGHEWRGREDEQETRVFCQTQDAPAAVGGVCRGCRELDLERKQQKRTNEPLSREETSAAAATTSSSSSSSPTNAADLCCDPAPEEELLLQFIRIKKAVSENDDLSGWGLSLSISLAQPFCNTHVRLIRMFAFFKKHVSEFLELALNSS